MGNLISGLFCFTLGLLMMLVCGTEIITGIINYHDYTNREYWMLAIFTIGCTCLGMGVHNIISSAIEKK